MSCRIDTSPLIASACVLGNTGLGVRGDAIPSTGVSGPPPLYSDIALPGDAAKEIRMLVTSWPSGLVIDLAEDSVFTASGPTGIYVVAYDLYVDGANVGSTSFTIYIGVHRPSGDVTTGGWTPTPSGDLWPTIDEDTASTTDYITSPDDTTSAVFALTPTMPVGTFTVGVGGRRSGATGQLRIVALNSVGSAVGATSWQTLTTSWAVYSLSLTTTDAATQFRIELQP